MKKNFLRNGLTAFLMAGCLFTTSCGDDDPVTPTPEPKPDPTPTPGDTTEVVDPETKYVIAATVGEASYLLTAESLDEGEVSAKGAGTEVIGGTYWVFKGMDYVFALVYNKGGAGTGASYFLNSDGKAAEKYEYTFNRITTYGSWGDNVITVSTGDGTEADAEGNLQQILKLNYLNAKTGEQEEGTAVATNFLGNGEDVSLSGIVEANGKMYTSVVTMGMSVYAAKKYPEMITDQELIVKADGGSGSGSYTKGEIPSTQYPDSAFVAIYSGSSFNETPVIARTAKIGYATGRMRSQYYQTIWAADNGDVYLFSPGYGRSFTSSKDLKKVTGTLPSGVVRIKAGQTDFDPDYYVNLEEIGTKKPIFRCWHLTEDYFLLQLYVDGLEGLKQGKDANVSELAIFKGDDKSIVPVTGFPADLAGFGGDPYGENGNAYIAVTVKGGDKPAFYKIDVKTGKATKGLTVDAESLKKAGKLEIQK